MVCQDDTFQVDYSPGTDRHARPRCRREGDQNRRPLTNAVTPRRQETEVKANLTRQTFIAGLAIAGFSFAAGSALAR